MSLSNQSRNQNRETLSFFEGNGIFGPVSPIRHTEGARDRQREQPREKRPHEPCPFCGGTERIDGEMSAYGGVLGKGMQAAGVHARACRDCGSIMRLYTSDAEKLLPKNQRRSWDRALSRLYIKRRILKSAALFLLPRTVRPRGQTENRPVSGQFSQISLRS